MKEKIKHIHLCILATMFLISYKETSIVFGGAFSPSSGLELQSISYSSSTQVSDFGRYAGRPFSIPRFNPDLGELQTIELEMSFVFSGDVNVFAPLIEDAIIIDSSEVFSYFHPALYADFRLIPGPMTQTVPLSGELTPDSDQITFENFIWNNQYNIELLDLSNAMEECTGVGDAPFGFQAGFSSTVDSNPPLSLFMDGTLDVDCTIIYNYTIPEPASMLILAADCLVVLKKKMV